MIRKRAMNSNSIASARVLRKEDPALLGLPRDGVASQPSDISPRTPILSLGYVLIRNMASNLAGQIVMAILILVSVPLFARHLGTGGYGTFVLVMTFVETFSLLGLGLNAALVKFIAELLPAGRIVEAREHFFTALILFSAGGLIAGACIFASAPWVAARLMKGAGLPLEYLVSCIGVGSVAFFFRFVRQITSCVPMAVQRFDVYNAVTTISEAVRLCASMGVLILGGSLREIMIITACVAILSCAADLLLIPRFAPGLLIPAPLSAASMRSLFDYSKFVFVGNLATRLVTSADNFLIGYFMPVGSVTYYAVPYAMGQKFWVLVSNLASVVFPAASAHAASPSTVRELYVRGSKAIAAMAALPAAALCILGGQFLHYWLGPEIAPHATMPLYLLSLAFLVNCLGVIPYVVLQGTHFPGIAARLASVYALVNLVLFVCLIPPFGVMGAAAAFLLSQILTVPWMVHTANRRFEVRWWLMLRQVYLPVLLSVTFAAAVFWSTRQWGTSLWTLAIPAVCGCVAYGLLSWLLILDRRERQMCRAAAARWLPATDRGKPARRD